MTAVRLRILFATVSGTARQVAEAISLEASDMPAGSVVVQDMIDSDVSVFDPHAPLTLLCISSTGSGDVPPDGLSLYNQLVTSPRYLGGLRYGLVALGDSSYGSTFCGGAKHFNDALIDLGAETVGEKLQLDATVDDQPETTAIHWFRQWRVLAAL